MSRIFGGSWSSIENWLKPKMDPTLGNLAGPNEMLSRNHRDTQTNRGKIEEVIDIYAMRLFC